MTERIEIRIPATCANLGPGFGVVGLAVDRCFDYVVEERGVGGPVVERPDERRSRALDLRHDAVMRGVRVAERAFELKLPEGLAVVARGTAGRGCGLGSNTADLTAGLLAALRYAKSQPAIDDQLGVLVQAGADAAHCGAALLGELVVAAPIDVHRDRPAFRTIAWPLHESWRFVLCIPKTRIGTAEVHRVLPPTVSHAALTRTAGRLAGLLRALSEGDEELLAECIVDEVHVPFRMQLVDGMAAAIQAGVTAGAKGVTISGHGPALVAFTTLAERAEAIGDAMCEAFATAGVQADGYVQVAGRPTIGS